MLSLDPTRNYGLHYEIVPMIVKELDIRVMVEIGVHSGRLTDAVLRANPDMLKYYMIDPWLLPKCKRDYAQSILDRAMIVADRYGHQTVVIRATSEEAFRRYEHSKCDLCAESADFVYIDGNHSHEHVLRDIEMWWTRVRPGGYLGGHDLDSEHGIGVRSAIEAAPSLAGLEIHHGTPPSNWHGVWICKKVVA